jgi:hypothetical protein
MAEAGSEKSNAGSNQARGENQPPLAVLRRLLVEIENSINQSRAVILSTRDAIEFLERLQGRQLSN